MALYEQQSHFLFFPFAFKAKKAVDGVPTVLKTGMSKAEAEGLQESLKALGGVIELA